MLKKGPGLDPRKCVKMLLKYVVLCTFSPLFIGIGRQLLCPTNNNSTTVKYTVRMNLN
jgi:hypothetical protein